MITATDVESVISSVDEVVLPKCRLYDEFDEGHPVYRIGDFGYIDAREFEGIVAGHYRPWLLNAYILEGNGIPVDDIVSSVNNGDDGLEGMMAGIDDDRLDEVYYTEC